jgi:hypothetical protein
MAVTRVTMGSDGSAHEEQMPSGGGGVIRSSDFADTGVEVRSGPAKFATKAHSPDAVGDDDLIAVNGMEITGKMARELGLLNSVFDAPLSSGEAARANLQDRQRAHGQALEEARSGDQDSEQQQAEENLRVAVEDGRMTAEEATVYQTINAEMAMKGIEASEVVEMHDGLMSGEVDLQDVDPETRQTLERYESQVEDAARKAVVQEVGPEGFEFLEQTANTSPEVNEAIRNFAIMRATGKANGLTWGDLLQDVREFMRGQ